MEWKQPGQLWAENKQLDKDQRHVSLHLASFPNEFSRLLIFVDGEIFLIRWHGLCWKSDDGSASSMRNRHLISNSTHSIDPSIWTHHRIYDLAELAKCSETPPSNTTMMLSFPAELMVSLRVQQVLRTYLQDSVTAKWAKVWAPPFITKINTVCMPSLITVWWYPLHTISQYNKSDTVCTPALIKIEWYRFTHQHSLQ